jgi:hypothetical protein
MPAQVRTPVAVLLALTAAFALSSCFGTQNPAPTPTPTGSGAELSATIWAGTDSEGDDWTYTFHDDGTVAVTFNDEVYDDIRDVWTVSGTEIVISVNGGDQFGEIIHTGEYTGLEEPMDLNVRTTVGEQAWTITIERAE